MENLAREKMEELSLVEAEEKYLQKKYTKDLGREIYQKGYSYTVSSQTGTITKIRPDTVRQIASRIRPMSI